ncbi:hypothetical protein CONLIGDRAFT_634612 [Coniochaeta ligniaria NRRL 30616]|uniref:Uncharacterized protein n=1 Tax=Coniochaeta ligniaria NRRL 30616 TaxID=1408157 RepID=A0A1J7IFX7_9PEZI|nr:hypothetical protein CONLIGDRAFT_634612 [Coniochaeta ligniaria NRRL 30616]
MSSPDSLPNNRLGASLASRHWAESDLLLMYDFLKRVETYFQGLRRQLFREFAHPDAEAIIALTKARDQLRAAASACGPGSTSRGPGGLGYIDELLTYSEALSDSRLTAWADLLQRTNRTHPNDMLLAWCNARYATHRYSESLEAFSRVLFEHRAPPPARREQSSAAPRSSRHYGRWDDSMHAERRARIRRLNRRDRDDSMYPSRWAPLRSPRRASPVQQPAARRIRLVCLDL